MALQNKRNKRPIGVRTKKIAKNSKHARLYDLVLVSIAVALSFTIALHMFAGPMPFYDDTVYISLGHSLLTGNFVLSENTFSFAFLLNAIVGVAMLVGNYSIYSVIVPTLFAFGVAILLTYFAARQVLGYAGAFSAAALAGTAPMLVPYSTRVLPTAYLAAFSALGIYLLLKAHKKHNFRYAALAGVAFGLEIYMNMEGIVLFLPLIAVLAYLAIRSINKDQVKETKWLYPLKIQFTTLLFMFVALGVYLIPFYAQFGSFAYPFAQFSRGQALLPRGINVLDVPLYELDPLTFLASTFESTDVMYSIGIIATLAVLGSLIVFWKHNLPLGIQASIFIISFAFLTLGSLSLTHYVPFATLSRFMAIALPSMALLAGYVMGLASGALSKLAGNRIPTLVFALALVALILLLQLPLYHLLGNYNLGINKTDKTYVSLTRYVEGMHVPVSLYIVKTNKDFGPSVSLSRLILIFISGYNKNITILTNSTPCYLYNGTGLVFAENMGPLGNTSSLYGWLGSKCTITQLRNFPGNYLVSGTLFSLSRR